MFKFAKHITIINGLRFLEVMKADLLFGRLTNEEHSTLLAISSALSILFFICCIVFFVSNEETEIIIIFNMALYLHINQKLLQTTCTS